MENQARFANLAAMTEKSRRIFPQRSHTRNRWGKWPKGRITSLQKNKKPLKRCFFTTPITLITLNGLGMPRL